MSMISKGDAGAKLLLLLLPEAARKANRRCCCSKRLLPKTCSMEGKNDWPLLAIDGPPPKGDAFAAVRIAASGGNMLVVAAAATGGFRFFFLSVLGFFFFGKDGEVFGLFGWASRACLGISISIGFFESASRGIFATAISRVEC